MQGTQNGKDAQRQNRNKNRRRKNGEGRGEECRQICFFFSFFLSLSSSRGRLFVPPPPPIRSSDAACPAFVAGRAGNGGADIGVSTDGVTAEIAVAMATLLLVAPWRAPRHYSPFAYVFICPYLLNLSAPLHSGVPRPCVTPPPITFSLLSSFLSSFPPIYPSGPREKDGQNDPGEPKIVPVLRNSLSFYLFSFVFFCCCCHCRCFICLFFLSSLALSATRTETGEMHKSNLLFRTKLVPLPS